MATRRAVRSKYYQPAGIAAFGAELLRNGGNASLAVRTIWAADNIKPQNAATLAQRLKATPQIRALLAEQEQRSAHALMHAAERFGATADRAAEELARLAFAQMRDVVDWGTEPDPNNPGKRRQYLRVREASEISDDVHRAIVEVTKRADGTMTIKLGDKQSAIMNLARLKGWIADKPEQPNQLVSLVIQR